jgi:hypothetical protein
MQWLWNWLVEKCFAGYDASECDAAIWILHTMYRNSNLGRLGAHDAALKINRFD